MENIIEPNERFDFTKLTLAHPVGIQGGAYFTKLEYNNKPLYIQTNKSQTRQGFVKTGKKYYCDLMFDKNSEALIHWFENLEERCQKLIFEKRFNWFQNNLEESDIETAFNSTIRVYKSGKYYLIRTNIKNNHNNLPAIKIYNETEIPLTMEDVKPETNIISILEIQGIKFTSRNFQIEIEVKQMMVLDNEPIFNNCLIKTNKANQNNLERLPEIKPLDDDITLGDVKPLDNDTTLQDDITLEGVKSLENDTPLEDVKSLDNETTLDNETILENVTILQNDKKEEAFDSKSTINRDDMSQLQETEKINDSNNLDKFDAQPETPIVDDNQINLEKNAPDELGELNEQRDNEDVTEMLEGSISHNIHSELSEKADGISLEIEDLNIYDDILDNLSNLETIQLKKPNQVYFELYKEARNKAKIAKKTALLAYLEAKNIKKTYMLENIYDSDSDIDEEIDEVSESELEGL